MTTITQPQAETQTAQTQPDQESGPWYTIRQASLMSGMPETTLRYYETIGIIPPIARDPSSGHRCYNQEDLDLLETISCLSATGMSLEHMREYLGNRAGGAQAAGRQIELLDEQGRRLDQRMADLRARKRYVQLKIQYWGHVRDHDQAGATELISQSAQIIEAAKRSGNERLAG
ncbi:MerR family transcriptional regulator [uncultured Bifidobacterium sp.]|uniref:MerR family transcriptional regulator n=1 Tax=uncultured Bifidobacterium sp. TaxID=165187 RepID=UPI002592D028|nr:MerR family transcriptional regulator [uncultured Bifidobacterium sp.]